MPFSSIDTGAFSDQEIRLRGAGAPCCTTCPQIPLFHHSCVPIAVAPTRFWVAQSQTSSGQISLCTGTDWSGQSVEGSRLGVERCGPPEAGATKIMLEQRQIAHASAATKKHYSIFTWLFATASKCRQIVFVRSLAASRTAVLQLPSTLLN